MSKNVNLIIFFISFCFTLNAQDDDIAYQKYRNNYSLDIFFEDGDSLPYVMQQGYIEYSNNDKDRIIQRHGNEIKFLYFLPPKYKQVKDTLQIKMSEHLDKIYKKDSLFHFAYHYEYPYPLNNVYIYPKKILSYYESIDTSFSEEAFDSIKNKTLYYPITYYKIDTPFRVVATLEFQEKLVEGLPITKVYHLNGLWHDPKRPFFFACVLREGRILQIQRALRKRGYYAPLNDSIDDATKNALKTFQKDYNKSHQGLGSFDKLVVGKPGKNTLKALGVSPFNNIQLPKYQYKNSPWNDVKY